jgi:uncharacterized protein (TIGR03435 family)
VETASPMRRVYFATVPNIVMNVIRSLAIAVLFATTIVTAQPATPVLEVASVRKHGDVEGHSGFTISGSRITVVDFNLRNMILEAYNVKPYQLQGGPDWMKSESYDVAARAGGEFSDRGGSNTELTREQARTILQAVLTSRFKLKVHRETTDIPIYSLVVGKNGSKMKESAKDAVFDPEFEFGPFGRRLSNPKSTMDQLLMFLASQTDRPVLDKTGLTGFHSYTLEWNSDNDPQLAATVPRDAGVAELSIFTAVQEQLGLKLESARGPVEMLVIESAEKPAEN